MKKILKIISVILICDLVISNIKKTFLLMEIENVLNDEALEEFIQDKHSEQ